MQDVVYAIIQDGVVQEYPVLPVHIQNRSLPWEILSPVVFLNEKPTPTHLEVVSEEHYVKDGTLFVTYKLRAIEIDQLLTNVASTKEMFGMMPQKPTYLTVLMFTARTLLERAIEKELDKLSREHGYADFGDLISFFSSKVEQYKKDAEKAAVFRDGFWTAFYEYLAQVESGKQPYPKSLEEVKSKLPTLNLG